MGNHYPEVYDHLFLVFLHAFIIQCEFLDYIAQSWPHFNLHIFKSLLYPHSLTVIFFPHNLSMKEPRHILLQLPVVWIWPLASHGAFPGSWKPYSEGWSDSTFIPMQKLWVLICSFISRSIRPDYQSLLR
jgi:hypothetical protein